MCYTSFLNHAGYLKTISSLNFIVYVYLHILILTTQTAINILRCKFLLNYRLTKRNGKCGYYFLPEKNKPIGKNIVNKYSTLLTQSIVKYDESQRLITEYGNFKTIVNLCYILNKNLSCP